MAFVRTVKTASGARAVQIVYSSRRGSRDIEHIASAHDEAQLAALRLVARQRLAAGQDELDLGLDGSPPRVARWRSLVPGWGTYGTRCAGGSMCSGSVSVNGHREFRVGGHVVSGLADMVSRG